MASSGTFCEPCSRGNVQAIGASWCSDCEEYLCELCERAHQVGKFSQTHQLVCIDELPDIPDTYPDIKFCAIHSENFIEYFCKFHDEVCCKICLIETHRSCKKMEQLQDVSRDINSSALVENMSTAITELIKTCAVITQDNKENVEAIQEEDKRIRTEITKFKQKVVLQLDILEGSLMDELIRKRNGCLAKLKTESEDVTKMSQTAVNLKKLFDFTVEHASKNKVFLLVEKMRHDILGNESKIIEFLKKFQTLRLRLTTNSNILQALAPLIAIDVQSEPTCIKYKSLMQSEAQFVSSNYTFEAAPHIDLSRHGTISISGIEITEDNVLLLCHFYGRKILVYKNDGTFVQEQDTDCNPYGIVAVKGKRQVAVTFPNSMLIHVVNTETIETITSISTENEYYGISVVRNLFVAGRENAVDLLSMDGKHIRTIYQPGEGQIVRFIHQRNNGTFLFSNSLHLFCIDILDGNNIFTYTSTTESRGIAEDTLGFIYVADRSQKNVHRVDPDGKFVDLPMSSNNELGTTISIRFNNDGKRMFIGMENSNYLAVFNCR